MAKPEKLLADVVARPDDLKARSVYADALQDNGDPRGEFIQLQLQAESLEPGPAREKVEKAAAKLEKKHRRAWIAELPMIRQATFARGLVDTVVATSDPFFAAADALFAKAPVRGIKLTKFNRKKHLAKLTALLAKWPLRAIDLSACQLDDEQIAELFAKANVSQLESLSLTDDPIGDAGARTIAALPFKKLLTLELGGSLSGRPGAEGAAEVLVKAPALGTLTNLSLWSFGVDAKATAALAVAPASKHLLELNLQSNGGGDKALAALAQSPHLRAVKRMNLGHCHASDKGVRVLLEAGWIDNLKARPGPKPWTLLLWQVNASAATKKAFVDRLGEGAVVW